MFCSKIIRFKRARVDFITRIARGIGSVSNPGAVIYYLCNYVEKDADMCTCVINREK